MLRRTNGESREDKIRNACIRAAGIGAIGEYIKTARACVEEIRG